jgi:hypothetical protein
MIRFFTNRELAARLDINLARWKRWSREFLPPDPLGGLQSGYARQYSAHEAFSVYFGGHLVARLGYTIPEARRILADLGSWLLARGMGEVYAATAPKPNDAGQAAAVVHVRILALPGSALHPMAFHYQIRERLSERKVVCDGAEVLEERYALTRLGESDSIQAGDMMPSWRTIDITALSARFRGRLTD